MGAGSVRGSTFRIQWSTAYWSSDWTRPRATSAASAANVAPDAAAAKSHGRERI
jgi:hypothetical protein